MTADESTPLIPGKEKKSWISSLWSPPNRVVLVGFVISMSFSFSQVSMFYAFRLMECDVFYTKNPPHEGSGDRCSRNEITAGTAVQFSILGLSTTFCGTWNLFVSGWQVKRWGPRAALILQTFIPAIRVATQIIGIVAGGQAGIWIIQTTQVITILGGPSGYVLVVNIIAGELVKPIERTALFGRLQGCLMLGIATGLLVGGKVGDAFGVVVPFQTAFFSFSFAAIYAKLAIPYIPADQLSDSKKPASKGIAGFFAPLKVLRPQMLRLGDGSLRKHYGVFFLCCGIFLGVLATGYAPILLQMYATAAFDFKQVENGWLLSANAFMRAVFLIFIFPRIIDWGRKWFSSLAKRPLTKDPEAVMVLPTDPQEFDTATSTQVQEEPAVPEAINEKAAYAFDLFFLRWSLLVDGALTAGAAFATEGWHMYLAAFLIPFGSGSAPAAKGVITSMCPQSQRADALNAVTLVENIARLLTLGVFGFIFSTTAEIGKAYITFFCNGAVAVVGMLVLLLSHFPPLNSTLVENESEEDVGEGQVSNGQPTNGQIANGHAASRQAANGQSTNG